MVPTGAGWHAQENKPSAHSSKDRVEVSEENRCARPHGPAPPVAPGSVLELGLLCAEAEGRSSAPPALRPEPRCGGQGEGLLIRVLLSV